MREQSKNYTLNYFYYTERFDFNNFFAFLSSLPPPPDEIEITQLILNFVLFYKIFKIFEKDEFVNFPDVQKLKKIRQCLEKRN